MVDRQTLVAANWKMNGTLGGIPNLLDALIKGVSTETQSEVVICPPFVYLAELALQHDQYNEHLLSMQKK